MKTVCTVVGIVISLVLVTSTVAAAEPIPGDNDRIGWSADGNRHDPDDWGATALALAIFAKQGWQDKLVHIDYNNWLPDNTAFKSEQETISVVEGIRRFQFDRTKVFDCQTDLAAAIDSVMEEINKSSADSRFWYVQAGPFEVAYLALLKADPDKRKHCILVSHSAANDRAEHWPGQHGKDHCLALGAKFFYTTGQGKQKFGSRRFHDWHLVDWMKNSPSPEYRWVFSRLRKSAEHKDDCLDASDGGMAFVLATGDTQGNFSPKLRDFLGTDWAASGRGPAPVQYDAQVPQVAFAAQELDVPLKEAASSVKPNVVVFYADDFGWGDMRRHNTNAQHFRYTPNLDRLFSQGVELANYMTHAVCSPSRAGLLTGKHYAAVGAGPRTGGTLPNDICNMAKDFQAAGYKTGAFGKWHNGMPNFPAGGNGARVDFDTQGRWNALHEEKTLDLTNNIFENHKGWKWGQGVNAYGFDRWVGYYNGGGDFFDRYVGWHHDVDWWHDRHYRGNETGYTTDLITKYAIQFIEANRSGPFFCYIPHEAVHNPLHLKRSDLKAFCQKLDSELGITGQWAYVSGIVSPKSGRRLGDVAELRCDRGQEFDVYRIDPGQTHFAHLAYAAFVFSLDKSIGAVMDRVTRLGKMEDTIFFFASDNGATAKGINTPFKGGKHSLWEGGVHVPAALWWPGTLDKNTAPYSPEDNRYEGFIGYIDMYPTLMAMAGQPCLGTDLDGLDCWPHVQARTECRPHRMDDPLFWMWLDYGSVRTNRWKLLYSESQHRTELYDLHTDIEETSDLASSKPGICAALTQAYETWIGQNNYAMSYMAIDKHNIHDPDPAPAGDVLEVKAIQTKAIRNPDRDGVFVRFSNGTGWNEEYDAYIHPGDRVEFDIYVCQDSNIVTGCFYTPGSGWNPFYTSRNGLNQDGVALADLTLPKGRWTRQVVGIGNYCPGILPVNFIALCSKTPGTYHAYLDNIVVRKRDGGIRSVIWQSQADFASLLFRYKGKNHDSLTKARDVSGFPLKDIQIGVVKHGGG